MTPAGLVSENKEAWSCPFCKTDALCIILENKTAFAVKDSSPVSPDHMLILPKRHCSDYFDMTREERCNAHDLVERLKTLILGRDLSVQGFNIGVNCGETAGQTIFHAHIHLIPRRKNDTPHPRGGVRGVIPDKMNY
jgi:diadenosine tetraphosphate (Ap4A) HIT family hydrolase